MYAGQIVEVGHARDFFPAPLHPYAQMLMASVPRLRRRLGPMFIHRSGRQACSTCRRAAVLQRAAHSASKKCDEEPPMFGKNGRKGEVLAARLIQH
jgi:peptide/nickel transport system ATP-binding protein